MLLQNHKTHNVAFQTVSHNLSQFFLHYHHQLIFSSLSSSTIQDEIILNMTDNHTQIWIVQDKDATTTKLMFKNFYRWSSYWLWEMLVTTQLATSVYTNDNKSNHKSQRKSFALFKQLYSALCLCYLKEYNHLASCQLHVPEGLMVLVLWHRNYTYTCAYTYTYTYTWNYTYTYT